MPKSKKSPKRRRSQARKPAAKPAQFPTIQDVTGLSRYGFWPGKTETTPAAADVIGKGG